MHEPFFGKIDGHAPGIAADAFVAPMSTVVGRVRVGSRSSVWYGCVLRADDEEVVIGEGCNIQDLSLMHADPGFPAVLGDRVSVGHRVIVHGARVEDDALVGMGATLLNGVRVGSGSVIAAGAVVTPGTEIPPNSLVAGVPAKVIREARESDKDMISHTHESYLRKSDIHAEVEAVSFEEVSR
ncbi:MAG: gamma carbonic anhydrase family protein [Actinomycetota bacterium]|jgi:carbonic anhydrase/acetyltransferase-like protein (isoleucine patch superfamily)|nr:gamma carbonic anhydrase family protein [Actinomycetota bacterium]